MQEIDPAILRWLSPVFALGAMFPLRRALRKRSRRSSPLYSRFYDASLAILGLSGALALYNQPPPIPQAVRIAVVISCVLFLCATVRRFHKGRHHRNPTA